VVLVVLDIALVLTECPLSEYWYVASQKKEICSPEFNDNKSWNVVIVEVIVIPIKILIHGAIILIVYLVIEPPTVVYRIVDNPVHLICNVSLRHVVVVIILGVLGFVDLLAGQIQIAS